MYMNLLGSNGSGRRQSVREYTDLDALREALAEICDWEMVLVTIGGGLLRTVYFSNPGRTASVVSTHFL